MPRRIPGLVRVLGAGSIASVAYGEIASSLYFALGVVALHALGLTPWVLLSVAALFTAHYFGDAVGWRGVTRSPWDIVAGVIVIASVAAVRLVRRPGLYRIATIVAAFAFVSHLLIIVLGFALVFSFHALGEGTS